MLVISAVNTRCIYHRIKASQQDPDNVTLCPVVDFANHTKMSPQVLPAVSNAVPGNDFTLATSPDCVIETGDELFLTYGRHANRTLFVDYGFINAPSHPQDDGEVDVQDVLESLIGAKGCGIYLRDILIEEGYWGYVIHPLGMNTRQLPPFKGLDAALWSRTCSSVISADDCTPPLRP